MSLLGKIHGRHKRKLKKLFGKKKKHKAAAAAPQPPIQMNANFQCMPCRMRDPARRFFGAAQTPGQVDTLKFAMQRNLMSAGRYSEGAAFTLDRLADVRKNQLAYGLP